MTIRRNWFSYRCRLLKKHAESEKFPAQKSPDMKTMHRFNFSPDSRVAPLEIPRELDLHVQINDFVEFEALPDQRFVIVEKTFKLLFGGEIEYIDYEVDEL